MGPRSGVDDALIGRQVELGALLRVLERGRRRQPAVAVVVGEAGIGKTRLVTALADAARARGVNAVWTAARRGEAPLELWSHLLRPAGGAATATGPLAVPERRWELLDQLEELVGGHLPALLITEDLHWADPASVRVLEELAARLVNRAVAIVATARAGPGAGRELTRVIRLGEAVVLGGLTADEVGALARTLVGGGDVDAEQLRRRTGGNPLFVREVLALGPGSGRVPPGAAELLSASLGRFDARTRRTLAALALAGPDTPTAVLAAALGIAVTDVADDLEAAESGDVVGGTGPGRAEFRHSLYADAAVALLDGHGRRHLHVRLAEAWNAEQAGPEAAHRRALHLVAALPAVDPGEVAAAALGAMRELAGRDDHVAVVAVGRAALEAIGDDERVPPAVRSRIGLGLGDGLRSLGDNAAMARVYERAAGLARRVPEDVELRARAEVAAGRYVNPFAPDPARLARLERLHDDLAGVDSVLHAELLGRLCVFGAGWPGVIDRAHRHGDAAIGMARRLGDPGALAQALADRQMLPGGVEGAEAKDRDAGELIALGERLRDPDIWLRGLEWRFDAALDRLELADARRTLERMAALAHVLPSPQWRHSTLLRRAALETLGGRYEDALGAVVEASALGRTFQDPVETVGVELGLRVGLGLVWGVADPQLAGCHTAYDRIAGDVPAPFLQAHLAAGAWLTGDRDRARQTVPRVAADADAVMSGWCGPMAANVLATLAVELGLLDQARTLASALEPFAARLGAGNGMFVALPVAVPLAAVAQLDGEPAAAAGHLEAAVARARLAGAGPVLARCLHQLAAARRQARLAGAAEAEHEARALSRRLGVVLPGEPALPPDAGPAGTARLVRKGTWWSLESPHGAATVPDSRGLEQLAHVLAARGREVAAVHLAGAGGSPIPVAAGLGPMLDARAKREYRQRIADLQADLDQAEAHHDLERAAAARQELDMLLDQLRQAVGLGGRDRPAGSGAERARVNVTRSMRRAIATVTGAVPRLGEHLAGSVRTGAYCSYSPEPSTRLDWHVEL